MTTFTTPFENQLSATLRETMAVTRRDGSLSIHAKHLLQELSLQSSGFVPRRQWIKRVLQCGEHVCRRVLKELRDAGHLVARHYRDKETGRVVGKSYVFLKSKLSRMAKNFARAIGQTDDFDVVDAQEMGFTCIQQYRDRYNCDAKWQANLQLRADAGRYLTEAQIKAKRAMKNGAFTETSVSAMLNPISGGKTGQPPAFLSQNGPKLSLPGRFGLCVYVEDYIRTQSEQDLEF